MVSPINLTPLDRALQDRKKETIELMGMSEQGLASHADIKQMQEIKNLFDAHKITGARLLQEGRISTEEYYKNTRDAGIKLGIIGEDEYPNDLPGWLQPTLEISGAVVGGIAGALVTRSLSGESVGAGLGSAGGRAVYEMILDFTAPEGLPQKDFEDVAEEALKEGALVGGLTYGIGSAIKYGQNIYQSKKLRTKNIAELSKLKGFDTIQNKWKSILNSKTATKLKGFKDNYLIQEQQKADDLVKFARNQGVTPTMNMVIQNEAVRSIVQGTGRTPLLGKPLRESIKESKDELFTRITVGVDKSSGISMEQSLAPLTDAFEKVGASYQLRPGINTSQLDDMGFVTNFLENAAVRETNIQAAYKVADDLLKKQNFNINQGFQATKRNWDDFNFHGQQVQNYSTDGRTLRDLLLKETNEMADNLFPPPKLAPASSVIKPGRASEYLDESFVNVRIDNTQLNIPLSQAQKFFKIESDDATIVASETIPAPLLKAFGKPTEITKSRAKETQRQAVELIKKDGIFDGKNIILNKFFTPDKRFTELTASQQRNIKDTFGITSLRQTEITEDTAINLIKPITDGPAPANLQKLRKYDRENLTLIANGLAKNIGSPSQTLKKFKTLSPEEKILTFRKQLNKEYVEALENAKRIGASEETANFAKAVSRLRGTLVEDIENNVDEVALSALKNADEKFVRNNILLENSKSILTTIKSIKEDPVKATKLVRELTARDKLREDILAPKAFRLGRDNTLKEGDAGFGEVITLDPKFKIRQIKGTDMNEYALTRDGKKIELKPGEMINVSGLSTARFEKIAKGDTLKSGDLMQKYFVNGSPDEIRYVKKVIGKENFKKTVNAKITRDIDDTLIRYLNLDSGEAGDAAAAFYKKLGVNANGDIVNSTVANRYKAMIEEAGLKFKFDELIDMVKMMKMIGDDPQTNQFIQRSLALRFSQQIGPGAVGGLFGFTAGGLSGGFIGAAAGMGSMYFFNKLMASKITGETVKGLIANYRQAVASNNQPLIDSISSKFVALYGTVAKSFRKPLDYLNIKADIGNITPKILKQTAIDIGVSEDY